MALLAASGWQLGLRLATLLSQDTLWQTAAYGLVYGLLLTTGVGLGRWCGPYASRFWLLCAAIGMLAIPFVWLVLANILPRLAPYLPPLDSWIRAFSWICVLHFLLLMPVVPALGAGLARTWRDGGSRTALLAGGAIGVLAAAPGLKLGFDSGLDTLQLFPAAATVALLLDALRPPRKLILSTVLVGAGLVALWPQPRWIESLEDRFGTLLDLSDSADGISMVTDDANRGRLVRGPDGRATYAQGMAPDDRFLAHLPLVLHGNPRKILFLGRGSGHPIAAAGTHPDLEIVVRDHKGQPARLAAWLSGPPPSGTRTLASAAPCDPVAGGPFDAIVLQPPPVTDEAFAACLSSDFLASVQQALAANGLFAMKIDPATLPVSELALLVGHLSETFTDLTIWAGQPASRWIAIASNAKQNVTLEQLQRFWKDPAVGTSLRNSGRSTPFHLLAEFLMSRATARSFADTFASQGATVSGLPSRSARHRNSNFGFAAATSDDWTVAILGGETILPDAFRRIFAQIERSETWRENPDQLIRQNQEKSLSSTEINQILTTLRASKQSEN